MIKSQITNKTGRLTYLFYKDARKRLRMCETFFSYTVIRLKFNLLLTDNLTSGLVL